MPRDVVITGLGVVTPIDCGKGIDAFWNGLCNGTNAINPIREFDTTGHKCAVGGEISGFQKDNRCAEIFSLACEQALVDSKSFAYSENMGISFGSILAGVNPSAKDYFPYSVSGMVARRWKLYGPNICVNTACSSGIDAIGLAFKEISSGRVDIMIAGAADLLSEFAFEGFSALDALTKDGLVRPFDKNRTGLALSDGAGAVILEEKEHAQKRSTKIRALVKGFASSIDAYHLVRPHPEGRGLSVAISKAIEHSGIDIKDVDFINAHGTGTTHNDTMETAAIKSVFGERAGSIKITSIKSMIGHALGASSVIEIISCIKAMDSGIIPPTINYQTPDPECDLDYVFNKSCKKKIDISMSLSAGFGGQNAAIVLAKGAG
jgi:3-oxoacyl-(acyl-carrier-protein) synthase